MMVNPDKLKTIIMSCDKKKENNYDFSINNSINVSPVDSVTLLGIEIDIQLSFEKHSSTIISFYRFSSRQDSLLYMHLYIINVFKYLSILSEIKVIYVIIIKKLHGFH